MATSNQHLVSSLAPSHSCLYCFSSSNLIDEDQFSEFWTRDDGGSGSEDDISDADDDIDAVKTLAHSSLSSKTKLNEKIELLQRAEEKYYQDKSHEKQGNKLDKNAISDTLRESSKQRLLNAVKQSQQRLGNLEMDFEASAAFLENECYKKFGKSGKSFYLSQMASNIRWLSTANYTELTRLSISTDSASHNINLKEKSSSTSSSLVDQVPKEITNEKIHCSVKSKTPSTALESITQDTKLPPIPSFSEFINSKRAKGNQLSTSENHYPNSMHNNREKRTRFQ